MLNIIFHLKFWTMALYPHFMKGCSKSKSSLTANPTMFSKHYLTLITNAIAIAAAKLLLYRQFILKLSRNNEKLSYNAVSLFNLSWRRSICHILADFCHSRSGNPAVSHVMNQQSTCLRILIVCIVKHAGLDVPWQVMSLHVAFQGGKLVLSETFDAACHDSLVHKQ